MEKQEKQPAKKKFDPNNVKVTRNVTLPVLKTQIGEAVFVTILEPIHKGELLEKDKKEGKKEEDAADLINVHDLVAEEDKQIVGGQVLIKNLRSSYPNDSYVGKSFQLTKLEQRGSGTNKYHPWSIQEIEV